LLCDIDFFFFQAEDGIRVFHVTGVQTCALPIWLSRYRSRPDARQRRPRFPADTTFPCDESRCQAWSGCRPTTDSPVLRAGFPARSEERRVGKEVWNRWRRQTSSSTFSSVHATTL